MKASVVEVFCYDHDRDYVVILSSDGGPYVDTYTFEEAWNAFAAPKDTRSSLRADFQAWAHTFIQDGELSYASVVVVAGRSA